MPKYKGIVENKLDYSQHPFEVEAPNQVDAEATAIAQVQVKLNGLAKDLEVLVCVQHFTQEEAEEGEKKAKARMEAAAGTIEVINDAGEGEV